MKKKLSHSILLENFFSLFALFSIVNLFPFITVPYLVRVLGAERYGLVAFAQSFVHFFNMFIDYGFNLSATKEISANRNDNKKISSVFFTVLIIKSILAIFSFLVFLILIFSIEKFAIEWKLYLFAFVIAFGHIFYMNWMFQGMEKMKIITVLGIFDRVIYTLSIFLFIKDEQHYIYVPLLTSIIFFAVSILSIIIAIKNFNIIPIIPTFEEVTTHLKEGFHTFLSTISYTLYTNSPTFFIGLILGNKYAGFYNVAERIIGLCRGLINIIFQVYYPHLANYVKNNFSLYLQKWKNLLFVVLGVSFLLLIVIIFLPYDLFVFVLSKNFETSFYIMKILSFSLVLQSLMNLFGMQSMLILGYTRAYGVSYMYFAILFIIIMPVILLISHNIYFVVLFLLLTEVCIVVYRVHFLNRREFFNAIFNR